MATRRRFLRALPMAGVAVSGCTGGGSDDDPEADVIAGPDSRLVFEPEEVTVSTGDTLTWYFESSGHNISCVPDHVEAAALPAGAVPFSSYEGDAMHRTVQRGETFSHTFETAGRHQYVCVPHVSSMTGEVHVEDG